MAAYYHGAPEIQQDGLQTLYLMNPNFDGYADAATPANMVYLNSAATSLNPMTIPHNLQSNHHQQQHLVGIPLQPMMLQQAQDPTRPTSIPASQQVTAVHGLAPRLHYNLWAQAPSSSPGEFPSPSQSQMYPRRPPAQQQGLSLSLSPQQRPYEQYKPETQVAVSLPEALASASASASAMSNGISVLLGSKFLKAAQLLLDEVVTVQNGTQLGSVKGPDSKTQMKSRESEGTADADTNLKRGADLPIAERQELQMKKSKLVGMLDEVEQRYRHYRHQMEIVVSSFEAVAGFGSARTYTALALQTISKQFQCLRDAITGQIRAASKSLGEEVKSAGSRLRFVDHQLRQQRALQQLGMIQHNAWRPQRGLPERAVSVLRAWLFEHFLHPYPKDADKHMLAKQTGLTRSQVSNWFINARVRLWKPMVEEMYIEEFKDQELNNADEKASPSDANGDSTSRSGYNQEISPTRTDRTDSPNTPNGPRAPLMNSIIIPPTSVGFVESHDTLMQPSLKKARSDQSMSMELKPEMSDRDFLMKFMEAGSQGDDAHPLLAAATNNHAAGFSAYSFNHEQLAPRFSGNGVSLTLGLPHSENLSLPGSQPSYLPTESIPLGRRLDNSNDYSSLNNTPTTTNHPQNPYDSLDIQNRKRFAAMLLPDFIA